jgi:hypothetical protein
MLCYFVDTTYYENRKWSCLLRKTFLTVFAIWDIQHITGEPHNPQCQAIVECMNGIPKRQLLKQKGE